MVIDLLLGVLVRRLLSVILLLGGLIVAGGANAATNLGTATTADCTSSAFAPASFTGVAGDYFTMTTTGGPPCIYSVSDARILRLSGSALSVGTNITVTILRIGTATVDRYGSTKISVSAPPAPTVTLNTANLAINATSVTITGTNFDATAGNNTVVFNNGAVGTVSAATSTQLTVTLSTRPTSTGSLTAVVTTNGQSSGSAVQVATVVPIPAPAVTSISPTSGSSTGGTSVTITGTNFTGATAVSFGGTAATGLTVISATLITATSPPGSGTVDVLVTTTGGTSATSSADQFTFLAPVDCVVSSWSAFGACSLSCGGGTQTQTRTIVTPDSNGGVACPALSQSQACNVQACEYQAPVTTPGGTVNAGISGGSLITAQATTPTNPPAGQSFPYGVFGFTAATDTLGGSITITLTYPQALAAGTIVFKDLNGTWLDFTSNVTFNQSRTTITYTIVDGGPFDSDGLVNQSVTDPIGPTIAAAPTAQAVPSLSEWTQLMLGLMVLSLLGWQWRKQQS